MIVRGMGKSVFSFIPLTTIPLTSPRPFPSSLVRHSDNYGGILAVVAAGRAAGLVPAIYFAEYVYCVVLLKVSPGLRTVEGKFVWWMESGLCCVSRQKARGPPV